MNRRKFFASLVGVGAAKIEPPKPKVVPIVELDGRAIARLVIPHLYSLTRAEGVRLTADR